MTNIGINEKLNIFPKIMTVKIYKLALPSIDHLLSFNSIAIQILFPFLVAGCGMVAAGIVLDIVQHWNVFKEINKLFILVPALLGLKGNLEMTLASRLSTLVRSSRLHRTISTLLVLPMLMGA